MSIDLTQSQLFLDDRWIADCAFVGRVWHQARKYPEPVLRADRPWEHNCPVAYGSVLRRDGVFHMWYCTWPRLTPAVVCYARSDDGVHWEKPVLGLLEWQGSTQNNIVLTAKDPRQIIDDLTVIEDADDARFPFKMLYWDGTARGPDRHADRGIWLARSRDGVRWERQGMVLPGFGDRFNALPVKYRGRFVVLGRCYRDADRQMRFSHGRTADYTDSPDLRRWSKPRRSLAPDAEDPVSMQIYSVVPFVSGGRVMGAIERMHMVPDMLDSEIVWSDDGGKSWQRSRTRPSFIPWGQPGHFDSDWINLTASNPVEHHGQLWFYYSGRTAAHGSPFPHNYGGIGLATLRIDGYASLRAGDQTALVLTRPMTWPGGDLMLNVDCRRDDRAHPKHITTGQVSVEVRDTAGKPLKGYTLGDCTPLRTNTADQPRASAPLRWGTRSMNRLRGRRVQLYFKMNDAHLYTFHADGR